MVNGKMECRRVLPDYIAFGVDRVKSRLVTSRVGHHLDMQPLVFILNCEISLFVHGIERLTNCCRPVQS
ncbi:unnamed protein product [Soboliphyme baturini]|uniref:Transposase n=1 Tax=Soboliphyme baturini TaxID=241478 RepID=A0A183J854_9BILA|nr:unnamed protein product [Soboliphyme baturini]